MKKWLKDTKKKESQSNQTDKPKTMRVQNALKIYLRLRGISARQLARDLELNHATLSRFLNGTQSTEFVVAAKVLTWLLSEDNITDLRESK